MPRFPLLLLVAAAGLAAPAAHAAKHFDKSDQDTTCAPCKDFYQYANGAWLKSAEIPASYSSIGVGREMADRNQDALRATLEDAARSWKDQKDPDVRKMGALYAGLMDSVRADKEGAAPMKSYLTDIDKVKSRGDLVTLLAKLQGQGEGYPFGVFG